MMTEIKEPIRHRYDWTNWEYANCDWCGREQQRTCKHPDGMRICSSCASSAWLADWQDYAKQLKAENESLRVELRVALYALDHLSQTPAGAK